MTQLDNSPEISGLAGKYLTFSLSSESYGVHILKVQEIIGVMHITPVPASPTYLKGVINLRGKIIPVVDLRLKFGLPEAPYDEKTCIIVVDLELAGKKMSVGVVVDTVLEVAQFTEATLEPAPEYGVNLSTQFVVAMGRTNEQSVIILIDIEKALADTPGAKFLEATRTQP